MEECVESAMDLNGVNFGLPFSSGQNYLFQEAKYLYQLNYSGLQQHCSEKQDDNRIEWTKDQRRDPVNGNMIKSFMWRQNFDVGEQMFNNLADYSVNAVCKDHEWKEIPSREYQNLIQQEQTWGNEAQDFLSSTLTPISSTIDLGDPPAFCSSNFQSAENDLLVASCLSYSMLLTGSSANRPGELGDVLSPVSVSHVPVEIVNSPEQISSVTVCSDGEWNDNKEPYEDGGMFSDSTLPCISESVSKSSIKPQNSDEVELNIRNYRGFLESNQNIYYENIPALHGQNVESSHLNLWTSEPGIKLVSEDNTLPPAISYQLPNLRSHGCSVEQDAIPPLKRKRAEDLFNADADSVNQQSTVTGNLLLGKYSESPICSKKKKSEISDEIANSVDPDPNTAGESCNLASVDMWQVDNGLVNDCELQKVEPDDQRKEKYNQIGSAAISELTEPKTNYQMEKDPKRRGVSLTDFFTVEQLKIHIHSLSQYNQGTAGNMMVHSICENVCQLCGTNRLVFVPTPVYCSSCFAFIKRNLVYYWAIDKSGARSCFCTKCFRKYRGDNVSSQGLSISKMTFQKAKNDEQNEESWVQCDKCERWQHQVCGLYNAKKDLEGQAKYICPFCRLKEIEEGEGMPLPAPLRAQDLPRTMLSDHIEQRLFRRLKLERTERAKLSGQDADEVPTAEDLIIRVVLSVNKRLEVKQQYLDLFQGESYPPAFQYRSKVILLFQNIEGVDVCLFGMYVQEFGSECAPPNKRCVYISYLDSIKYFRPEIQTVKGEALRTFVYHEILIGYLEYCKKRGFTTCYIWACPPVKGEDYILHCHPENQKTPKPDKLRLWYRSMLRKASEEDIVVNYTNLYDHFFVPSARNNARITAAHLPYFDGGYWSGAAEDLIRNIDKESRGDSPNRVKKLMTKRTVKAIRHNNLSADATKDILVMQKLGQTILPVKEDFIIVNLHVVCTDCHEAILSGSRWFCDQCRNFNICGRCLALKENPSEQKTHTSISGEQHSLSEVVVDNIPADTEDGDTIMDNDLLENRHSFLSFCQENHYQFDALRRAKHSSMMILYHLYKKIHLSKTDPDYESEQFGRKRPLQVKLMGVLVHALQCRAARSNPCPYSGCLKIRTLFRHASRCNVRAPGGCELCLKTWSLLHWHSQTCQDFSCRVPRCMDIKKHVARNSSLQR